MEDTKVKTNLAYVDSICRIVNDTIRSAQKLALKRDSSFIAGLKSIDNSQSSKQKNASQSSEQSESHSMFAEGTLEKLRERYSGKDKEEEKV